MSRGGPKGQERKTVSEAGPIVALAGLVSGLLAGQRAGPGEARVVLVGGVAGMLGAWFVTGRARMVIAALGLALLGAASMQRALDGLVHHSLTGVTEDGAEVFLRGSLVADPDGMRFGADVLVRVDEYAPAEHGGSEGGAGAWTGVHRTVLVRASGDDAGRLLVLSAGDGVMLRGYVARLEGFDARRRWQHGVALLSDAEVLGFSPPGGAVLGLANRVRAAVLRGGASLPETERSLIAGFLLGDTRRVPRPVVDEFRAAGLSHLLAVSGANVAFALALVRPALGRLGITGRLTAGLAVVVVFAAMTRFEPSVLRASAMAAVSLSAGSLGRPTSAVRLLAIAVAALMLADPFLLHSVGFALSCGACAGIALLARPLAERFRGPVWLREPLAVTLAAQVGVAPVMLPVFGSLPAVAPLANILAVPVAGFLGVFGLAAGVLGGLVGDALPEARDALNLPAVAAVRWIAGIADLGARVPFAIDARAYAAACALSAALWVACRRSARPRALPGSLRGDAGEALPDGPPRG